MIYASAPGKLNLFFEVGALRADGYHPVTSIYQALAIRQRVGVEASDSWLVETTGKLPKAQLDLVPTGEDNLCVVAAKALANFCGITEPQPMRFSTYKEVPVAAGLAGGSADAAASLLALNEIWNLKLSREQLSEVAAAVGSDVPFSLLGGTALGVDTGIELRKLPEIQTQHVVLLVSPIGLSTKEVFGEFDRLFPAGDMSVSFEQAVDIVLNQGKFGKNSLSNAAVKIRPELAQYQQLVSETLGYLSGSGPTIYFITKDKDKANSWANQLQSLGHFVIQTTTSDRGAELG